MSLLAIFSITMIGIGAVFMTLSMISALGMVKRLSSLFKKRWLLLIFLKGFFLLAYLLFITVLLMDIKLPLEILTGPVFMGGGFFVFLIIRLTKITVNSLSDQEQAVQRLNESLEDKVKVRTCALQKSLEKLAIEGTKREKANLEISRLSQDLHQILNTISTGIRVIDLDCHVLRVNESFSKLTGIPVEELTGSKCYENFHNDDCHNSPNCRLNSEHLNAKISTDTVVKTTRDGRKIHLHLTSAPMTDENGTVVAMVEDFNDITALVEAQKETDLIQSRLHQAAKLESVGQLAAGIAHEINTPVQFISTNLEFLTEGFEDIATFLRQLESHKENQEISEGLEEADWDYLKEEIPQALEQTTGGVERVRKLILAMKEFSHPGTVTMAPTDVNAIINNTTIISQNEWKMVAELETDLAGDLPMPPCKSDEIGQVLLNIVVNAAHAIGDMVDGTGKKGKITIRTSADAEYVEIRISDSGTGMSDELRHKIFDPFFTTKEVGSGSGQGLAIAHDIVVNKHHGEIKVTSTEGEGSTFLIRLPREAE
jgi:PAS domain S-box-containing protein